MIQQHTRRSTVMYDEQREEKVTGKRLQNETMRHWRSTETETKEKKSMRRKGERREGYCPRVGQ